MLLLGLVNRPQAQSQPDSLVMDLKFTEISANDFMKSQLAYFEARQNPEVTFESLGLTVTSDCDEICEAYLVEKATGEKMWLPSNFDAGVADLLFSPLGKHLIVFSSYDGPDYGNFYDYRSEFYVYAVGKEKGLKALQLTGEYTSKDWSMEAIVWMNNQTIVLKVYEGPRSGSSAVGGYKYLKSVLE